MKPGNTSASNTDSADILNPLRKKHAGKVQGDMARLRLDRPGRKLGGRVGADSSPLSTAGKKA